MPKVSDMSPVPKAKAKKKTAASPYHLERLPNGLVVGVRPMPQMESAAIGVWVRAGGRYETSRLAGVSHFLEHLLFKGTHTRSCEQLKQAVEGVGGSLNGFTAEEFTCYVAKVPARHAQKATTILCDMALHPRFAPRDIAKEREVILEEIRMYEDSPGQYVHELLNTLLWPNHPLGHLLAGSLETVRRMTRTEITRYWRDHYHPRNLLVTCAGAVETDQVVAQLRKLFAKAPSGRTHKFSPAPRSPRGPQVHVIHKATEQTHVCLGIPTIPRTHPARFAVELLHVILGANMSSRLFREIREKRGLAYEIGTQVKRYKDTGAFVIYAGCDAAKLQTSVETAVGELARIKRERVPAAELRRAKDFYAGQLLMGLEDSMEHMIWMGEQLVTAGGVSLMKDVIASVERVTAEQVQQVARMLFVPSRLSLAVIGPVPKQDADPLERACQRCA
ncbi:MAG: insulinase family protein [Candidatus Omnitrophica bacterium]|nr:insulinase family protein [Candidatus Omnitrophota bacterium]